MCGSRDFTYMHTSFVKAMNLSNETFPYTEDNSEILRPVLLIGMSLTLVIGIPGNCLIFWTFVVVKRFRTHHNMFVASLAATDTVLIGYLLPQSMAFITEQSLTISSGLCKANALVAHICFTSGVQTVMHIAINRFVKICCSTVLYSKVYSSRNMALILFTCWIMGFVFWLPLLWVDDSLIYDASLHICVYDRYNNRGYSFIYLVICLAVPTAITTGCYVKILAHVSTTRQRLIQQWNNGLARARTQNDMRTTKAHITVFAAYMIIYMPFGVTSTCFSSHDSVPSVVHSVAMFLCYINSAINSIIYGVMNKSMRKCFKEALCAWSVRKTQVTPTVTSQVPNYTPGN